MKGGVPAGADGEEEETAVVLVPLHTLGTSATPSIWRIRGGSTSTDDGGGGQAVVFHGRKDRHSIICMQLK
jgi:hypothetical protein